MEWTDYEKSRLDKATKSVLENREFKRFIKHNSLSNLKLLFEDMLDKSILKTCGNNPGRYKEDCAFYAKVTGSKKMILNNYVNF